MRYFCSIIYVSKLSNNVEIINYKKYYILFIKLIVTSVTINRSLRSG